VGEALRRVTPESAEFVIEIATAAPTAAQALHDHQARSAQIAQAVLPLGVQRAELQTISLNVLNFYAPVLPGLPQFGGAPQIAPGFAVAPAFQQDVQFGACQVKNLTRVLVREAARVGEVVDALTKAGASLVGGFCFRVADEAGARRAALEEAARDARSKAETLASAAGRQLGDPQSITEDIVASNGVYTAWRAQAPFALGPAAPAFAGELEYYARVSANFRFHSPARAAA
jgi:uncharacterized protein YggE